MYDWDDLRIFLAASRAETLSGAAQRLLLDAATVGRRLSRLEAALKTTLFTRSPGGLKLTAAGLRLLDAATAAEAALEAAGRATEGDVGGGTVRLSVTEGFGTAIVAPALPALRAARPGLRIELAAQTELLSPSKREADVAVTLSAPSSKRLLVEPLTEYRLGLYASGAYLEKAGAPENIADLRRHEIVGYVDDLLHAPELRYLDEVLPELRPTLSSSSIRAQRQMLLAAGGIGVLPFFLATGLTRVLADEVQLTRRFWLSTHRDVADTARVRVVRDWLKKEVKRNFKRLTEPQ
jgi:DNA-binding transcriptional LysR family regulator